MLFKKRFSNYLRHIVKIAKKYVKYPINNFRVKNEYGINIKHLEWCNIENVSV